MKYTCTRLFILTLMVVSSIQAQETSKQSRIIIGTRVSLTPPDEFVPAPQFPGLLQEATGSSIMVTEMPGPFSQLSAAFSTPSELAKRGMTLLKKQGVTVGRQNGLLLHLTQMASGTEFRKWLLLFGNEKEVVMVTATFPKMFEKELSEKLRTSVLSATWDSEKSVSSTDGLNFGISEKGEMRLAKRVSNMLLYSKGAIFPSADADDPVFIAGPAISNVNVDDPEEYAKWRILQTASVTNIEIERSGKVVIDKLNGHEIVARARDTKSGKAVVIYQTMLFEGQRYFLLLGIVGSNNRDVYLPVFKAMAESFKRKRQ